eukprot:snap_masked-scaffold_3-processed-gene-4.16-mRNA-1 protein AED:1.00 eAED:1.00 QI:0/0/0/0/1/1/2/0/139
MEGFLSDSDQNVVFEDFLYEADLFRRFFVDEKCMVAPEVFNFMRQLFLSKISFELNIFGRLYVGDWLEGLGEKYDGRVAFENLLLWCSSVYSGSEQHFLFFASSSPLEKILSIHSAGRDTHPLRKSSRGRFVLMGLPFL